MALKLLLEKSLDRSKPILPAFTRATSFQTLGKHKFASTAFRSFFVQVSEVAQRGRGNGCGSLLEGKSVFSQSVENPSSVEKIGRVPARRLSAVSGKQNPR